MPGSPLGVDGKILPGTGQTWDWPEADERLQAAGASVLVMELFTGDSTAQQRLAALNAVVDALIRVRPPLAISWPQTQRVSDPAAFDIDALDAVLNVRMFTVAGDDDVLVLDTLGLHTVELPDLQCHFRDREPGEIAALLHSTASYVFDEGDVIDDGDTISGLDGTERYRCFHEPALLAPSRTVVDVDLGDPYAAGERTRPR